MTCWSLCLACLQRCQWPAQQPCVCTCGRLTWPARHGQCTAAHERGEYLLPIKAFTESASMCLVDSTAGTWCLSTCLPPLELSCSFSSIAPGALTVLMWPAALAHLVPSGCLLVAAGCRPAAAPRASPRQLEVAHQATTQPPSDQQPQQQPPGPWV